MPAVLTHKAIMLLARDRLGHLAELTGRMIERKQVLGTHVTDIEQKIHRLARDAHVMMSSAPSADVTLPREQSVLDSGDLDLFGGGVSKFAIMGSMGPDLPAFAELFNPGQGWAFDTIHKGTPDYNREAVVAGSTDMALSFYINALIKIRETYSDDASREPETKKVQAYVMGHLCHVAADVISHPFINDLEWHLGVPGADKLQHSDGEVALDAMVARRVFRRGSTREGQAWSAWWPAVDDVPAYFFDAYSDAFTSVYGSDRPKGFGDFEEHLADLGPPEMSPDFIRDGYKTYRGFILTGGYHWGYWDWFGLLTPLLLPMMFAPLISYAMPHSRQFFEPPATPEEDAGERAPFEMLTLPFQLGSLSSLIYGALLLPFAKRGAGGRSIAGLVMQSYTLGSLIVTSAEAASVDKPEDGIPAWARWLFLFAPPVVSALVYSGLAIDDDASGPKHPRPFAEPPGGRRKLIDLVNLLPLFCGLAFAFVMLVLFLITLAGDEGEESPIKIDKPGFWVPVAIWMAAMIGLWIGLPFCLRDQNIPEHADDEASALKPHGVRLFDETTLFADPTAGDGPPVRYFPSDYRPLCKLWWEGEGDMQIRSERFGLVFLPRMDGAAPQTVPGPLAPMTVAEYIQFLSDTVADGAGVVGGLKGEILFAEDAAAYELPTGAVFASHGDLEETEAGVLSNFGEFKALGDSADSTDYVLYHAPKPLQAVQMGPRGSFRPGSEAASRTAEDANGYTYILDPVLENARHSDSIMAKAADLGALLCMGAADHMSGGVVADERVYQIFRNWNLDRRRVNEWRMIVEGGALSDKGGSPERYDAAMPQGLHGPINPENWTAPVVNDADPTALSEAEETARTHGWIGTLRDWLAAVEEGENILDTTPTRPDTPSNRALSRGLAYLFDASDPAAPPPAPGGGA